MTANAEVKESPGRGCLRRARTVRPAEEAFCFFQKEERRNPALSQKGALAGAGKLSSWQNDPRVQEGAVSVAGEELGSVSGSR